jgi:transmembrane sensor
MKIDKEYFGQLVLFEISGKIEENERAYLHQIISEDQEAYNLYVEMHNIYSESRRNEIREKLGAENVWIAIRRRKRARMLKRSMVGIAAVSIITTLLYIFFIQEDTGTQMAATNQKGHIELQLASGQTIDLSNNHGQVQVGNIVLNNKNKELSYSYDSSNIQLAKLSVPPGKDYTIHLQDGTEIQLNAATSIEFPFAFKGNTREISINGEAYIKVAKDEKKPFLVHLPGSTVMVLGTEFNVNTYDTGLVKVALVDGSVKMKAGSESMALKPGYEISLTCEKGMLADKFDVEDVLAWRQGIYLFNSSSIVDVAKLIHRFYGVNVKLEIKTQNKDSFTGSMNRNEPIKNFLDGLKYMKSFDYYFDKDSTLHIK